MRCGKIVCVGQNYRGHVKEMRSEIPEEPVLFLKATTAVIADGEPIVIPHGIGRVDPEAELAIVIGRRCRNVSVSEALGCIESAAILNDVTARDMQSKARKAGLAWSLSKSIDTFCPMSETSPLADLGDLHDLGIELRVNGQVRQKGNTGQMIFPPEELIAYTSRFVTLERGDVISTGTPEGVAPILPGDVVEITIDGLGRLSNPVKSANL
jgi:acylpyruvate hydrolase